MAGSRPGGVTLVAVLAWLNGAFHIVGALFHLFTTAGWVELALGIVTIIVSLGLFRGSNVSRVIMTLVFVVNIAVSAWLMFAAPGQFWAPLTSGVLALIGLLFLYTNRANAFFRG